MSFDQEVAARIAHNATNGALQSAARHMMDQSIRAMYSYNFSWMGRPVIQYPQDIVAVQDLVWQIRPTLIVETGIAHGGSLILSASMLALLDMVDGIEAGTTIDPAKSARKVVAVDIDIRSHNRAAIENHPMASRIEMLQGSSIDPDIVAKVHALAAGHERVLVFLDSMHTGTHVLAELNAYAPLVSVGSYCVVFDTVVENLSPDLYEDRPWTVGDNPMTAVDSYVAAHSEFAIDTSFDDRLLLTVAPRGFLKRSR